MGDIYDGIGHAGVFLLMVLIASVFCAILGVDIETEKPSAEVVTEESVAIIEFEPLGNAARVILAEYPVWKNEGGETIWHEDGVERPRITGWSRT